jgi:hypothetical protein
MWVYQMSCCIWSYMIKIVYLYILWVYFWGFLFPIWIKLRWNIIYGRESVDVLKACVQVPTIPCEACNGVSVYVYTLIYIIRYMSRYTLIWCWCYCWARGLCDLSEKPSIGCRILILLSAQVPRMCLDDEFVRFNAQFTLLTIVFVDQHATYNVIWNTL